jgi:hypothetical protein
MAGHPAGLGRGGNRHHAGNAGGAPFSPLGCFPSPALDRPPAPVGPLRGPPLRKCGARFVLFSAPQRP